MFSLVTLATICTTFAVAASPVGSGSEAKALDACLRDWAAQDMFSGVALVARDGKILLHQAYGRANAGGTITNSLDTRFRIGSLTKAFTAVAVLQLEQQGSLSVQSPLSAYLPDYPRGHEITLEMLLNHRSGIVDHATLADFLTERRVNVCPVEKTIETFKNLPLEFSPGAKFKYSNSGFILLGAVIEKVTQKSYADVVRERILDPLGMDQTGFEYHQRKPDHMAAGCKLENSRIVKADDRVIQNAHASGAIFSTARDLYTWDRAFQTGKLLNKASLAKVLDPARDQYSYGWAITRLHGKRVLAHIGETEGYRACMLRFIDDDACVILLSNFEHCSIDRIGEDLAGIVFGKLYQPSKGPANQQLTAIDDAYVGRYQLKPGLVLNITREGPRLFCQPTGQDRLELRPRSPTNFFIREVDVEITFVRDGTGQVQKLLFRQKGRDLPADKQK